MIVAQGLGDDTDYRGTIVGRGYGKETVGGAPPTVPPLPYGDDNTDRIMRHDRTQWARRSERIDYR